LAKSIWRWVREIAFVVLAAIVLSFVLKTFLIESFYIPSASMENTLLINDRVMVSKLAPGPLQIHRGDIVVFKDPGNWLKDTAPLPKYTGVSAVVHGALQAVGLSPSTSEEYLIKRVIGLPGDHVQCDVTNKDANGDGLKDHVLSVNGVEINEPYVKAGVEPCSDNFSVTVAKGGYWVMGDNRSDSADSRLHRGGQLDGAVAKNLIVGVAQVRTWPFSRMAILRNPGKTFAKVPATYTPSEGDKTASPQTVSESTPATPASDG
jgi:signal peptidase I